MCLLYFYLLVKKKPVLYLFLISILFTGCFLNFYKPTSRNTVDNTLLTTLKNSDKYFIVHLKDGNYALKNLSVNNNLIDADVEPVATEHTIYLKTPNPQSSPRYKKKDQSYVLNEVHMYAEQENIMGKTHLSIPLASITRIDVYEKDKSKTSSNHTISIIGATIGGAFAILMIAFAIACNCPQVYVYDGSEYQFKSGVFSGAVYSSLEKTDYLPLTDMKDANGKFKFRLMNNQMEEQYVNQVQLVKVNHDASENILFDRKGIIHSYKQPVEPASSSLKNDKNAESFKYREGRSFLFNEKEKPDSKFASVILTFDKPSGSSHAKLIVNAKNSIWSGYIFEQFSSLFGNQYQKFIAKQDKVDKQKIEQWERDQALPLMVYIETDKGWKQVDYFAHTGNTAGRDMIMALDISGQKQNNIRIKLESAFMFWDVDYAAMDYSADINTTPTIINVSAAGKTSNSDEVKNITGRDNQYSKLLQNDFLSIEFDNPAKSTIEKSTYFLVSTGYYHSLKEYPGKADLGRLYQFKKPGAFSAFSEKKISDGEKILAKGIDLRNVDGN
ncbi:MAG: hypothetical protein ACR2KX_09680 [Chitinophagaceae bacterium]